MKDPIVAEVRRIRHEHEVRHGLNLDAILADLQAHQAASKHPMVRLKPRKPIETARQLRSVREDAPPYGQDGKRKPKKS